MNLLFFLTSPVPSSSLLLIAVSETPGLEETFIKSLSPLGFTPLSPRLLISFKEINFRIPPTQNTLPQKKLLFCLHWSITEVKLISHTIQSGTASHYVMSGTSCRRWFQILGLSPEKMDVLSFSN